MPNYIKSLSNREEEIYNEILNGKEPKEIAETLVVGLCTVKSHISNILRKKKVKNRIELLAQRIKELE